MIYTGVTHDWDELEDWSYAKHEEKLAVVFIWS